MVDGSDDATCLLGLMGWRWSVSLSPRVGEHHVDFGYPSAELISRSADDFGITLITPVLLDHSPQARAGTGFDAPTSPSTSTASKPPVPKDRPAHPGAQPPNVAPTRSSSPSRLPLADRAPSGTSAPSPRPGAASSPCTPARPTTLNAPPAPGKTPPTGRPLHTTRRFRGHDPPSHPVTGLRHAR